MTQYRFPFSPYPDGWFYIELSHNLPKGKLISKTWMGEEIVAWRDNDGQVCVADAFCPHLGAHLGPKAGGCVKNGHVVCPFHQFAFDSAGKCASTPYGPAPKNAKLKMYPVQEVNGIILAHWDNEGREPTWDIPELPQEGWGPVTKTHFKLRSHPQETTENSVDPAHFGMVHGYRDAREEIPLRTEGPYLTCGYSMNRSAGLLDRLGVVLNASFVVHAWGLGYSVVYTGVEEYGIRARQWSLATPIDGEFIDLVIALQVKDIEHPDRILPGLGKVPRRLMLSLIHI